MKKVERSGQETASNLLVSSGVILAISTLFFREQVAAVVREGIVLLQNFTAYLLDMVR